MIMCMCKPCLPSAVQPSLQPAPLPGADRRLGCRRSAALHWLIFDCRWHMVPVIVARCTAGHTLSFSTTCVDSTARVTPAAGSTAFWSDSGCSLAAPCRSKHTRPTVSKPSTTLGQNLYTYCRPEHPSLASVHPPTWGSLHTKPESAQPSHPAPEDMTEQLHVQAKPAKLDIKKDGKGVVTVPGATQVDITSARALLATIERYAALCSFVFMPLSIQGWGHDT